MFVFVCVCMRVCWCVHVYMCCRGIFMLSFCIHINNSLYWIKSCLNVNYILDIEKQQGH